MVAPTLVPTLATPVAPLAAAGGATPRGIPASLWVALTAVVLVVAAFGYYTAVRARERSLRRSGRTRERSKGLSAEQIAFQEEMRLMLQARIVAKGDEAERAGGESAGEPGPDGGTGGSPLPPAIV